MKRTDGFQLADLVVALAIFSLGVSLGLPALWKATVAIRLRIAADEVVAALRQARSQAIRRNVEVAVKFTREPGGVDTFCLYRDGDGDGVTNADIKSGTDRRLGQVTRLEGLGRDVHLGLPARRVRDPGDSYHYLDRIEDPIRFNSSDLASFGPLGTSTPGSIYLTDGQNHLAAVRVYGRTAKVRVLEYDFVRELWREP